MIEIKVREVTELLHLEDLLERKPKELNGGQRQRFALGRAPLRETPNVLFDEPLSNLDAHLRSELRGDIKMLHLQLKSTMIYVTRDQVEAMTLGDRIAVIRLGLIEQLGSPKTFTPLQSILL